MINTQNAASPLGILGKSVTYPREYDPSVLYSLARAPQRESIGLSEGERLPFFGADLWTGYELSWLNTRGKPQVAILHAQVPCESPNLIESKSFKLYLNSFNSTRFASTEEVIEHLRRDLSACAGANIGMRLVSAAEFDEQAIGEMSGLNLDRLDIECQHYEPAPHLLCAKHEEPAVSEVLTSRLLRSQCPVTGQPDWGSVQISYTGAAIDQERLLQYIVSFRNHSEFHEHCAERMFMDIWQHCRPLRLSVYARYTRRGGLDINPLRTSYPMPMPSLAQRTARQ